MKHVKLTLDFHLRGEKKRIPSVSFIGNPWVPLSSNAATDAENAAFKDLSDAAHRFCAQMKKSGEFE